MLLFILSGVFVLGLSVFIHELGHLCFGYLVGVKAEIFSIGYGKGRIKKKIGVTTWQITAIPLGGYVKFYGDENPDVKVPNGFYNVSPLKRIIPVLGGPFFNLILAFIVYLVLHSVSGPLAPKIAINEEEKLSNSPAYNAGLQNGDNVLSVDGKKVTNFMDMAQVITLSSKDKIIFEVDRNGKILKKELSPETSSNGMSYAGIRMPGERYLQVNYSKSDLFSYYYKKLLGQDTIPRKIKAYPYLKNGDIIVSVENEKLISSNQLQNFLSNFLIKHPGQPVKVKVLREKFPIIAPWPKEEKTVMVPVQEEYNLMFTNIIDKKYNIKKLEDENLLSIVPTHQLGLNYIKINNKAPGSFQELLKNYPEKKGKIKKVKLKMASNEFEAEVKARKFGLLGFRPSAVIYGDYLTRTDNYSKVLSSATKDLVTNILIYPVFISGMISGRFSFIENAAGPVRIFGTAGLILQTGYQNFLQFFAAISIALFVLNLMPFPIVDGGHIVFFLYEAIFRKPVSARFRDTLNRLGFSTLMFFGLWIMYKDIIWLVSG